MTLTRKYKNRARGSVNKEPRLKKDGTPDMRFSVNKSVTPNVNSKKQSKQTQSSVNKLSSKEKSPVKHETSSKEKSPVKQESSSKEKSPVKEMLKIEETNLGIEKVIGVNFLTSDGQTPTTIDKIIKDADLVGIYWSAHWCKPCREFTPKLVTFVEMLEEDDIKFPIIFASGDKSKPEFEKYFSSFAGPQWSAFPPLDKRITALKKKYGAKGIPWLVILDKQGNLICNEADTVVPKGPQVYYDWLRIAK